MADPDLQMELRLLAQRRLAPVITQVLEKADDALFDLWQNAGGSNQAMFDAMRELRRQRASVEDGVRSRIADAFMELPQLRLKAAREQAEAAKQHAEDDNDPMAAASRLSLLDPEALEEQLACERLAAAVERKHTDALTRFAVGIAQILQMKEVELADLPLAPLKLALAWRDALTPALPDIEWRLVAHKLLERILTAEFGQVIDELCKHMVTRGLVIKLPPQVLKRRAEAAGAARPPGEGANEAAEGVPDQAQAGGAPVPIHAPLRHGGWVGVPGFVYPGSEGGVAGGEGGTFAEAADPLYHVMRDMFAAYLAGARPATPLRGPGGEPIPLLDSTVALAVLGQLQHNPTPGLMRAVEDHQIEFAGLLGRELLKAAIAQGKAPTGARLEPQDEQALTVVGMLFDTLLDQGHFIREVRERFVRLCVPYAQVAILDRRLFEHKTHPARRLLNLLAEACEANAGEAPAERDLLKRAEEVSRKVIEDFSDDPGIFILLEREFGDFLAKHRRRVELAEQRTAEAQRGRERLEQARIDAALELDSLVGGRRVPKAVGDFLSRDWTHHLTMVALKDGIESDAFRDARMHGVKLWLALQACEGGAEPPTDLLEMLAPAMKSAGQGEDAVHAAVAEILAVMRSARHGYQAPPSAPTTVRATAGAGDEPTTVVVVDTDAVESAPAPVEQVPAFEIVSAIPEPPAPAGGDGDLKIEADPSRASPEYVEKVRALKVGNWVEFIDRPGSTQPAKLSWISPISSRLLFVNRRGMRLCAVSAEELAAMMAEDKLLLRDIDSAFERAMSHVIGKLQAAQGKDAGTPAKP